MIIADNGKSYLFVDPRKVSQFKKNIVNKIQILEQNNFLKVINNFKKTTFCIDENSCSIFDKQIIKSKFKIVSEKDPIYNLKSIKNPTEINNTKKIHIEDGVALTKFLYWFKNNKKKIDERTIEKKLQKFRKRSKNYLYPSFDTIAGSGPNGAIIHYKSSSQSNRTLKKNDILLIDSGGQYKWGTTDVQEPYVQEKFQIK